jgi:hypothetical protein
VAGVKFLNLGSLLVEANEHPAFNCSPAICLDPLAIT